MSLIGYKCPPNTPTAGNTNDFSWCVNSCPHQCAPTAVLYTQALRETGNEHKGDMLSPSALNGCARALKLERTTDYFAEPPKLFAATRGALIHGFLECPGLENVSTEQRLFKVVPPSATWPHEWVISGRVDFYDHKRQKLEDIKTMADKGLYIIFNKGVKKEHVWQLNIYRWLMNGGHLGSLDGPSVLWPVKEMQIHYMMMNRVYSSGRESIDIQTQKIEPNFGKKYVFERTWPKDETGVARRPSDGKNKWGATRWQVIVDLPAIPFYSATIVEQYLMTEGPSRLAGFADPLHMPAGVMLDPDKNWQCDWCQVKNTCDKIEKAEAVVRGLANDGFQKFLPT